MPFRFQTKLTLVFISLFLAAQLVIGILIYQSGRVSIETQVLDQLGASARAFSRIVSERNEVLRSSSALLAEDFAFREAVATADQPTVRSALQNFSSRLGTDLAMLVDENGGIVASVGLQFDSDLETIIPDDLRAAAERNDPAVSLVPVENHLLQMVVVPVYAPIPVAWLALAVEVDLDTAVAIKQLSPIDLEIAFLYRASTSDWQLAVATFDEAGVRQLILDSPNLGMSAGEVMATQAGEYLFWRQGAGDASDALDVAALLYYSTNKAFASFEQLTVSLIAISIAGLVILSASSYFVARSITRPLSALAESAKNIAEGDYHRVANVKGMDIEIRDLATSFDSMVEAVSDREQHIKYQATHDPATGLPNRFGFEEAMRPLLQDEQVFSIVAAELADAATVRSSLDFDKVMELFKEIGHRIQEVSNSSVARLASDMFFVLLPHTDRYDERKVIQQLIAEFQEPIDVQGVKVDVSFNFGFVKYPSHGLEIADLLRKVGLAVYHARATSQNIVVYTDDCDSSGQQTLSMMSDMRRALENQEIQFAYQPKIDLKKGTVYGVEALIRWFSKERGFVRPDIFIPLAERTGDIAHITEWALNTGIRQAADWLNAGLSIKMAINLSAADLMDAELPMRVKKALNLHGLPAKQLILEVTESALMQDVARAISVLEDLNRMGITLSIDDYGTGYSSLSYLKRLPVKELKIDMSFIQKLATSEEDEILVRSTIDLGHNLGMSVTAEGVEDTRSVEILQALKCDVLQGYHFSKPVPAAEIPAFIKDFKLFREPA